MSNDPSDIIEICWFSAQEIFIIIINVENSFASLLFCGNCDTFLQDFSWMERLKEQY